MVNKDFHFPKCKLKRTSTTVIRQKSLIQYLRTSTEGAQTTSLLRLFRASIHLLARLKTRQLTRLNCFT